MMKLTIHTTRQISSADLRLAIDPPLSFEIRSYISYDLNLRLAEWQNAGRNNASEAAALINQLFVSVGQNGHLYPLNSPEAVNALRETIEATNPGEGDNFLIAMLNGFVINHYNFFSIERNGSAPSLPASENGSSPVS